MTKESKSCLIKLILIYFRSTRFVVNDHFPLVWAEQNCLVMIMETERRVRREESSDHPLLIDTNYRMRHSRTFFNEIFLFNGGLSDCAGVITRPQDLWMQQKWIQGTGFNILISKLAFSFSILSGPQWLESWVACKYFKEHFRDTIRSKKVTKCWVQRLECDKNTWILASHSRFT